jgi:hypothetical protein
VVNILREGKRVPTINIDDFKDSIPGPPTNVSDAAAESSPLTPQKRKLYEALHQIIDSLPYCQRTMIEADLVAGCDADNAYLAGVLRTTKNSIYVSRNKAREKIRTELRTRYGGTVASSVPAGIGSSETHAGRNRTDFRSNTSSD